MATNKVDFHRLGNELWQIANIFRDDTLKTTEYLEEFSYFLFLKLFDDQEIEKEEAAKIDGKKYIPYLPDELRFYTWANKIVNGDIPINEVVPTVKKIFQDLANIKDHDGKDLSLFRRLFRNHIWRIKYGPTIRDLLKRLIDLELEQNFDVMGRAYEFVVQKLGEQKQYGQYFTPRHIIHFMVEIADPDIGEKIYDPAAGTGGFILRAFEVVSKKIQEKYKNDYSLAEKYFRELKEKNLWAVEKAPDVYKLALMNMILHNDGKSNLYEADSLDNRAQIEHKEKYDVVLTNPPYGPLTQSRVGVFEYHVKRFEALFIQHIMNALKFSESGKKPSRAVVIILDKILFDSTRAFKNIRKKLLREYNLKAVFSMPPGIFQPYAGVKTSILYFEKPTKEEWNKTKSKNEYITKHVLFFDVKSDGFTLSTQRRPINGAFQGEEPNIYDPPCGDLPRAVEVFREWLKALDNGKVNEFKEKYVDNEQAWIADIEEIKEKDFNLNPGLYKKVERGKIKWQWVKLGEVINVTFGKRITKKQHMGTKYPVYGGGGISFYTDEFNAENEIVISRFGMSEKCVRYVHGKFWLLDSGFSVNPMDENRLDKNFLYFILKSIENRIYKCGRGVGQKNINMDCFYKIEIPLPPLEIQQKIVERLDKQQAIIEKAKEMEKAILEAGVDDAIFDGDWEWVELGKVIKEKPQYGANTPAVEGEKGKDIRYIRITDIDDFGKLKTDTWMTAKEIEKKYFLEDGDLLFARSGATAGKTFLYEESKIKEKAMFAGYFIRFKLDRDKINPKFLFYFTQSNVYKSWVSSIKREAGQPNINAKEYLTLKIPLPPLEKQKEIVEFLDVQFEALEKIRKLRENAEEMIKLILEKEVFVGGEGTS